MNNYISQKVKASFQKEEVKLLTLNFDSDRYFTIFTFFLGLSYDEDDTRRFLAGVDLFL